MTVRELIDFYLAVRQPGGLIGFDQLHEEELEGLKEAIQAHYGSQEKWLALPEDTELPGDIAERAASLKARHDAWLKGE